MLTNLKLQGIPKFAKVISYIFDSSVLVLPMFIAVCFYKQQNYRGIIPEFITAIFFAAFIPYMFILYLYKSGKISDLHMPNRKERFVPLFFTNLSIIMGFIILLFLKSNRLLISVYIIYLLGLVVISLITLFWKISFHSSYITIFSIVLIIVFGKWAIFTILLIPLVSWVRIKLKSHTLSQILSGIAMAAIISLSVFYFRGYFIPAHQAIKGAEIAYQSTSYHIHSVVSRIWSRLSFYRNINHT
jgi:hypothetical protein